MRKMARLHHQIIVLIFAVVFGAACGSAPAPTSTPTTVPLLSTVTMPAPTNSPPPVSPTTMPPTPTALSATATTPPPTAVPPKETEDEEMSEKRMRITVGEQTLMATLIDNATTRSLVEMLPLTLPMRDLYSRELVYRFPEELPANETETSGYEVGDISYWTPANAFVIFYAQNGEIISNLQKIGHIDSGVEILDGIGSVDITFELLGK